MRPSAAPETPDRSRAANGRSSPVRSRSALIVVFFLTLTPAEVILANPKTPPVTADEDRSTKDLDPNEPPLSTYDRKRLERGEDPLGEPEERTLIGQLGRTLVSLILVVALIYLFARFGLQRFVGLRRPGGSGKLLNIVERLPLDAKHALYVVEYAEERLLLGTGDRGLELLARGAQISKGSFRKTMDTASPAAPIHDGSPEPPETTDG